MVKEHQTQEIYLRRHMVKEHQIHGICLQRHMKNELPIHGICLQRPMEKEHLTQEIYLRQHTACKRDHPIPEIYLQQHTAKGHQTLGICLHQFTAIIHRKFITRGLKLILVGICVKLSMKCIFKYPFIMQF